MDFRRQRGFLLDGEDPPEKVGCRKESYFLEFIADLPLHVCSCLVVTLDIFSFNQFRATRDQVVISLVETATQSTFWVDVRLLEDAVLVPTCCEALTLGCDDKATTTLFGVLWVFIA